VTRYAQRTLIAQPSLANWGKAAPTGIGVVEGYGVATGGTTLGSPPSGYTVLEFTADGNLVVSSAGLFDYYLVAGGGAGGTRTNVDSIGGGGGAGGIATGTVYLTAATYAIDIGAGGTSATGGTGPSPGVTSGSGSSLGTTAGAITAGGGGRGGFAIGGLGQMDAQNGGCGGASNNGRPLAGSATISGVTGFNGGSSAQYPVECAAGGGGAGAVGASTVSGTTGGAGGAGVDVSTFIGAGSPLYKSGGGGGGGSTGGAGGSSVGGAGGSNAAGTAAAANTGSGGGGAGNSGTIAGGAGGSGIVYIRFKV